MNCNYLEVFWESKDYGIYYIEEKNGIYYIEEKKVLYCIAGICSELKPCQEKCRKWVDLFQVSHDMHQAILELFDSDRCFKNICEIQSALKRCVYLKSIEQLIFMIKM